MGGEQLSIIKTREFIFWKSKLNGYSNTNYTVRSSPMLAYKVDNLRYHLYSKPKGKRTAKV